MAWSRPSKRRKTMPRTRFRWNKKRRFSRRRRGSKYAGTQIISVRRSVQQSVVGNSTTGAPYTFIDTPNVYSFSLDRLPQVTEFTSLFKEYKIVGAKLRFHLRRGPGTAGGLTSGQYTSGVFPQLYYSTQSAGTEFDDIHFKSINNALEDPSTKMRVLHPERPLTVWIGRPHVATNAYGGATASAYTDQRSPWISTLDATVYHYGGRFLVDSHIDPNQYIDIVTTLYVKFRGMK